MKLKNKNPEKILIRCPNWVGDVVMVTPALRCIRDNFPKAKILLGIKKYAIKVLEGSDFYDEIIEWQDKSLKGYWKTVRTLREIKPDIAILFTNSFRSALTVKSAGIPSIIGYKRNYRSFIISSGPTPKKHQGKIVPEPMSDYYLKICSFMKLKIPETPRLELKITAKEQEKADQLFEKYNITKNDTIIALNPGAKFGSSKCWPPEFFAKLSDFLKKQINTKILILAGPGEKEIADSIATKSCTDIINTYPDKINLAELKPVIKRCDLLITNDTGPRHFAAALGVPHIVIMGPTDSRYTNAFLEKAIIITAHAKCAPCHKKTCPTDHKCMQNISPEMVLDKTLKLLENKR